MNRKIDKQISNMVGACHDGKSELRKYESVTSSLSTDFTIRRLNRTGLARQQHSTTMALHPYQKLDIDERVKRVLASTPLIDGHNDLPQQPRACFHGKIHNNDKFDLNKGFERGMTDIPRLREGMFPSLLLAAPCMLIPVCRRGRGAILVRLRSLSQVSRELLYSRVLGHGQGCDRAN